MKYYILELPSINEKKLKDLYHYETNCKELLTIDGLYKMVGDSLYQFKLIEEEQWIIKNYINHFSICMSKHNWKKNKKTFCIPITHANKDIHTTTYKHNNITDDNSNNNNVILSLLTDLI